MGLMEDLRIDVELQQQENLEIAMNMARALERKQRIARKAPNPRANQSWSAARATDSGSVSSPNKCPNMKGWEPVAKGTGSSIKSSSSSTFVTWLMRAEMAKRRAKGLCYNWDECYSVGHKCKELF